MIRRAVAGGAALAALALPAAAHTADATTSAAMFDALPLAALAAGAIWFAIGHRRLPRRRPRRALLFAAGLLALLGALAGPLDAWAARSLAAHMTQHLALTVVAAPLLAAAAPLPALFAAFGRDGAIAAHRLAARLLQAGPSARAAALATIAQAAVMSAWHLPLLYQAALRHAALHILEHATLLASALWFWHAVARALRARDGALPALACLLLTLVHAGMLGGLMVFAGKPLYPAYAAAHGHEAALAAQQWAGLILWVPGCAVYLAAALLLANRFLNRLAPEATSST